MNSLDNELREKKEKLIEHFKKYGYISSEEVIRAFRKVPREEFVGENQKKYAYMDRPLPILKNQTISAPHMVAMMVNNDCLGLEIGDKCLEIGGGSGYHAAVIAEIVAPSNINKEKWGHVFTIERVKELVEFAKNNIKRTGYSDRVSIIHGDGSLGLPEEAPYDKITVACAAPDIPPPLIEQLKPGGRLVIPVGGQRFMQQLVIVNKLKDGTINKKKTSGVAFVPMIGKHGF